MEHVDRLLSDYLDGELNHEAADQVAQHLARCAACTRRHRSLRRTVRFVRANSDVEIAPGSTAASIERFNRALMHPAATDADVTRVLWEEAQRLYGWSPPGEQP